MWTLTKVNDRPALILQPISGPEALASRRSKVHDLKGAIRTVTLARDLDALKVLGNDRAAALERAIEIIVSELKIIVEGYDSDC